MNAIEFFLRNRWRWRRPGVIVDNPLDRRLAEEVGDWLAGFDWPSMLREIAPRVADIGAKNFFLAPALDSRLRALGYDPELHGIEIDAYRRYRNLRTRLDYGRHYAALAARGSFHAMDFLRWQPPLDAALLLHPFVTEVPLRAWGLPRRCFRPAEIFAHAHQLLRERGGILILSCPSVSEWEVASRLAFQAGFTLRQRHDWRPHRQSLQQRPRLGGLFLTDPGR